MRARSCPRAAHFDVFADHPYSVAATPTKHAYRYDDVLISDLSKVAAVVRAADALRTVTPRIPHRIWVTEWSWFTNPPDRPMATLDPWLRGTRHIRCMRCGAPVSTA